MDILFAASFLTNPFDLFFYLPIDFKAALLKNFHAILRPSSDTLVLPDQHWP